MAEVEPKPNQHAKCPKCGAELPADLRPELCPKCLLKAAMAPAEAAESTKVLPKQDEASAGLPRAGDKLGHYSVIRLLGEGGMGAVFEAQDLETERRVALKVLSQRLDAPDARQRFLREGRLAASLNHPNSVYVFGTEEIGGTPVIAMELVSGGTLQERVRAHGPLPPGEAVDAVLQIIAGLEAAQRVGILHRDVKPSNCFLAADGTVKIGDFGLSISTSIRVEPALTVTGAFLGTPAFCSPEQLRGDELSPRSDIYAVGATLYYLLTGHTPFEASNVVQMLATILERTPPSPRALRPSIPRGLANAVLRCLEKEPSQRFRNYEELARALAPFSSRAPTPAMLGLRLLAGIIDTVTLGMLSTAILWFSLGTPADFFQAMSQRSPRALLWLTPGLLGSLLYYALLEGRWGAALGKAICRLRVVGKDRNPPGFGPALMRAILYSIVPALPYWIYLGFQHRDFVSSSSTMSVLMGFSFYLVLALYFSTARQRNGFAAVQDLLTRTRVISLAALESRVVLRETEVAPPKVESLPTIGPYYVLQTLEEALGRTWLLGYDLRLLRKVWIRAVPEGTPVLAAPLRELGRVGRLRWLTGRRSSKENWDAFEALSGRPLLALARQPQPWAQVRFWLYDLASEISAAEKEGTLPELGLDRVWITAEGRAKLLDFPAPGTNSLALPAPSASAGPPPLLAATAPAQAFLSQVAASALAGHADYDAGSCPPVPLPLHARKFLSSLPHLPTVAAVSAGLKPLLQRVASVSRLRRAVLVAGCMAFPLFAVGGMVLGLSIMQRWNAENPGIVQLSQLLQQRASMRLWGKRVNGPNDAQLSVYIAAHYRGLITNETAWSSPMAVALIKGESRQFAERSIATHPEPTEQEIADVDAALRPYLSGPEVFNLKAHPWLPLMALPVTLLGYVCIPALIAALAFRGGLVLLITSVAFARRDGVPASRLRIFWRGLVAWSPLLLGSAMFLGLKNAAGTVPAVVAGVLLILGLTIVSVALPNRGLQDRLAGTWPVAR